MSLNENNLSHRSGVNISNYSLAIFGVLSVIYLLVVLYSKSYYPLLSYDEAWYASISHNLIKDKSILHMTFNGSDYYDHPPLGFWLMSISMILFGESELSVRLPSMIASILSLFLVYKIAKKRGNVWTAWIPALMLASSLWFVYRARSGNLDSLLVFFFIWVIYATEKLVQNPKSMMNILTVSFSLAGLILIKTLVGLGILPAVFFIWITQSKKGKHIKSLIALLLSVGSAVILCMPWYWYSINHYAGFYHHHFLVVGTREGINQTITYESLKQTLLYFRSGVGKWYYPGIIALLGSIVAIMFKRGRMSYLPVDLVWFLGVSLPFILSPKTEVWHLIPIYTPLFLLIPSLIEFASKIMRGWEKIVPLLSLLMLAGAALVAVLQLKAIMPLLHQSIEFDRKDIALQARGVNNPISMKTAFLPAFVYYSGKVNVGQVHLNPKSYELMTECLTNSDCKTTYVIDNTEIELLSRDNISFNTIASNSSYMIIDHQ